MSLLRREELKTLLEVRKQPSVSIFLPMHRVGAEDRVFWQHQSDGLALFLAAEVVRSYRLPLTFDELVVVNDHFHLKPLLPLLTGDRRGLSGVGTDARVEVKVIEPERRPQLFADTSRAQHMTKRSREIRL